MKSSLIWLCLVLISLLAFVGYGIYTYQYLPENMASHFDSAFEADGWSDKYSYMTSLIGVTVFMNILILGLAAVIRFVPESLINSPHKSYWLETEERKTVFYSKIKTVLYATLVLLNSTFLFIHHMAYQYNVPEATPRIPGVAVLPVVLTVTILFMAVLLIWAFIGLKPPKVQEN